MAEKKSELPDLLVEGIDYYIEAGRWVFTAAYHLRRGHCCESGCLHCPYRAGENSGAKKPPVPSPGERLDLE